jgi:hypothetical protein
MSDPELEVILTEEEAAVLRPVLEAYDDVQTALIDAAQRQAAQEIQQRRLEAMFKGGQACGAFAVVVRLRGLDPAGRWLRSSVNPRTVITADDVTGVERFIDPRWQG